jgi:hypothetical protein
MTMALSDDVENALREAGHALKGDLWRETDGAFLKARAKDLVGLATKAQAASDPQQKRAYVAAARDVVNHVKLLAVIRMETAAAHVLDALGRFFMEKIVPALATLLPALLGI